MLKIEAKLLKYFKGYKYPAEIIESEKIQITK
jgi:hypothetical protein